MHVSLSRILWLQQPFFKLRLPPSWFSRGSSLRCLDVQGANCATLTRPAPQKRQPSEEFDWSVLSGKGGNWFGYTHYPQCTLYSVQNRDKSLTANVGLQSERDAYQPGGPAKEAPIKLDFHICRMGVPDLTSPSDEALGIRVVVSARG